MEAKMSKKDDEGSGIITIDFSDVMSPLALASIEYAEKGYRVFPVHGITKNKCDCGKSSCTSPGKHPISKLVPHGDKNATSDTEKIRNWWKKFPNANIGLVVDAFLVIDVDGEQGRKSLKELGELPYTAMVETGRGEHYYFSTPEGR